VVGTVILFGFLIVALGIFQIQVVPTENANVEFEHSQQVEDDFGDLRNDVLRAGSTGSTGSTQVRLGTRYPARTFFINPPPVSGSLETEPTGPIRVLNATVGDGDPETTANAARRAVSEGFDCVKLKVGARSLDADVERLRAVRDAVGDGVSLRADANGAWDPPTAREALDRLEPIGLDYVEQPLPGDDLEGAAALRAERDGREGDAGETPTRIALDESLAHHSLDAVLDAGAADVVVLKPMALGGPDRALAAAATARAAGVDPVVTTTIDAVVARTAAVHVAAAVPDVAPCGLATASLLEADLAPDPCPVADGAVTVPDGPGLAGDAFDGLP